MQTGSEPIWELDGGLKDLLADGGEEIVAEILDLYLVDSAALLEEILATHGRGERPKMVAVLHRMKGSALQAGAMRLAGYAREAEMSARAGDFVAPRYLASVAALRTEWELGARAIRAWLAAQPK